MNRVPPTLLLCLLACACGQKGALYLPEESAGEVVVRPPPAEPAPRDDAESGEDEDGGDREEQ